MAEASGSARVRRPHANDLDVQIILTLLASCERADHLVRPFHLSRASISTRAVYFRQARASNPLNLRDSSRPKNKPRLFWRGLSAIGVQWNV